jgi:hypothetical protein
MIRNARKQQYTSTVSAKERTAGIVPCSLQKALERFNPGRVLMPLSSSDIKTAPEIPAPSKAW